MLFSIIVPVYNVKKYLSQCVDSILKQLSKDFEVILVDDGSTDGSGEMCDKYAELDDRVRVIHKENSGQTSARKVGALQAEGKYIIPIDGDDWVGEILITDLKVVVEKYQPDIICYGFYRAFGTGKLVPIENSFESGYYDRTAIVKKILPNLIRGDTGKCFLPCVWGKVIKRDLYRKYQLQVDERIRIGEDLAVAYPCISHAESIYIVSEKYYYYRINERSITKQREKGYPWEEVELIVHTLKKNLCKEYNFDKQIKRYYCRRLFNTAKSHLQTSEDYWKKRQEIINHIIEPENRDYIETAEFNNMWEDAIAQWALKHKYIFIIKIYAMLENVYKSIKK